MAQTIVSQELTSIIIAILHWRNTVDHHHVCTAHLCTTIDAHLPYLAANHIQSFRHHVAPHVELVTVDLHCIAGSPTSRLLVK